MACACMSKLPPEQKEAVQRSKQIDGEIKEARKNSKIKLLLLGAGESGKSTIAKQMKIIHLNGYNKDEEKLRFKPFVHGNVLDNIFALVSAAEQFGYQLSEGSQNSAKKILALDEEIRSSESKGLTKELVEDIKRLWADPAIQQAFQRSSDFQLGDSAEYFFSNLDRISAENYVPTVPDILRVRTKTTGINEIEFTIGKYNFKMTDVGGQRSERRKWIHCFDDVTAIIFCAALSEYDQKLYEDQTTNRMFEALKLFSDITNSRWFNKTPIILFLNKKDIFESKIKKVPLNVCFKNYTGSNEPNEAADFIEKQFLSQIKNPNKLVYKYRTCATDTNNVKFIFHAVKDVLITAYLNQLGIGLGNDMDMGPPAAQPASPKRKNSTEEGEKNGKEETK